MFRPSSNSLDSGFWNFQWSFWASAYRTMALSPGTWCRAPSETKTEDNLMDCLSSFFLLTLCGIVYGILGSHRRAPKPLEFRRKTEDSSVPRKTPRRRSTDWNWSFQFSENLVVKESSVFCILRHHTTFSQLSSKLFMLSLVLDNNFLGD